MAGEECDEDCCDTSLSETAWLEIIGVSGGRLGCSAHDATRILETGQYDIYVLAAKKNLSVTF